MTHIYTSPRKQTQTIRQLMSRRGLFHINFQYSELYAQMKRFIIRDFTPHVSNMNSDELKQSVTMVFDIIEKEMAKQKSLKRLWMKTFTVHGLFRMVVTSEDDKYKRIIAILVEQLQAIISQLCKVQQRVPSFFSKSFATVKRSLSAKGVKELFSSSKKSCDKLNISKQDFKKTNVNKQNDRCNGEDLESIRHCILVEYVSYLLKVVNDWEDIEMYVSVIIHEENKIAKDEMKVCAVMFRHNGDKTVKMNVKQSQPKQIPTSDVIWKMCNYFKILSKISRQFQRLCQLMRDYEPYMFATIEFMAEDIQMLYNPIVEYLGKQLAGIKWADVIGEKVELSRGSSGSKSSVISTSSSSSIEKGFVTTTLSRTLLQRQVYELKSLVDELGNVNEVVLFVFSGYYHYQKLYNKRRPKTFVSINHQRFDQLYDTVRKMEAKEKKRAEMKDRIKSFQLITDGKGEMGRFLLTNPELTGKVAKKSVRWNFEDKRNDGEVIGSSKNIQMVAVKYKSARIKQAHESAVKKIQITAETDVEIKVEFAE